MTTPTSVRPPRLSEAILGAAFGGRLGADTAGDLAEEFNDIAARHGSRAARRWYRRQVMRSVVYRLGAAIGRSVSRMGAAIGLPGRPPRLNGTVGPAWRGLRRAPWYSATVIAAIALSLALATTVFAIVDGVLFKPLPYASPDRLVAIELERSQDPPGRTVRFTPEDVERWQAAMPDVPLTALRIRDDTGMERMNEADLGVALVRPNVLEVLGVRPLLGGFTEDDLQLLESERPPVRPMLITYEFWQSRFGGDVGVVRQQVDPVDVRSAPILVAGVLPPGVVVPTLRPARFVMPAPAEYASSARDTTMIARLPDGITAEAFRSRLEAAMASATVEAADGDREERPDRAIVIPVHEHLEAWEGPALRALFAGLVVLVLIACLNVSGLMTARCLDRARDIGLRRAIGARTRDVVALLVVEHALLYAAGTALGLALAYPLLGFVLSILPPTTQLLKAPAVDVRVLAFVAVAMGASLFLASIWPVRRALTREVQQLVVGGGSAVTLRASGVGARVVMACQIAGTVVLVLGGGLLVASVMRIQANDIGYERDGVVVAEVSMAPESSGEPDWDRRADIRSRVTEFLAETARLPGVSAAGAAEVSVLTRSVSADGRFDPVNRLPRAEGFPRRGTMTIGGASGGLRIPVTPGFFQAAGIVPAEGRLPTNAELAAGASAVAVSRSFARANFGDRSALGELLTYRGFGAGPPTYEIVGVVDDPRLLSWDGPVSAGVFTSYASSGGDPSPVIFIRTDGDVRAVMTDVIQRAEAGRPVLRPVRVQTLTAMLGDTIRERRLQSWLFGAFSVASLMLSGVGLLGLVTMTMARRTREIGIRMALGAGWERLVSGLVREQLVPVAFGLVAGVLVAAWAVRFLESYLYELSVYDSRIWVTACVVVVSTAVTGALIPALRASRVDPVLALRE